MKQIQSSSAQHVYFNPWPLKSLLRLGHGPGVKVINLTFDW